MWNPVPIISIVGWRGGIHRNFKCAVIVQLASLHAYMLIGFGVIFGWRIISQPAVPYYSVIKQRDFVMRRAGLKGHVCYAVSTNASVYPTNLPTFLICRFKIVIRDGEWSDFCDPLKYDT